MPRIDFPGAFHHVYARGIEKRDIFADDDDRGELRRRVVHNLSRLHGRCLAWALMPNHFHLLFHSTGGNLPSFMRCLLSGYAMYFNRKYKRVGHLFQNRYVSSLVESESYLVELIRYIHLNPVRSGLVPSMAGLGQYRWTGHREIVRSNVLPWKEFPLVQAFFEGRPKDGAVSRYLEFLEEGLKNGIPDLDPDSREAESEGNGNALRTPSASPLSTIPDRSFEDVARMVCMEYGIPFDRLRGGRRSRVVTEVRRKILSACVLRMGMTRRDVSSRLGITLSAGSALIRGQGPGGRQ